MSFTRRDFLKASSVVLAGTFWPGLLSAEENSDILGESLRHIWRETTIAQTLQPVVMQTTKTMKKVSLEKSAGENLIVRNDLLSNITPVHDDPKTLLFFGHLTDAHVTDEESPGRIVSAEDYLELIGVGGCFRPQEDLTLQVLDSMNSTLNKIGRKRTFDFLLNTGDFAENAHQIELNWFLETFEGKYVDPDSGRNEDPKGGPENDANDPFKATGFLPEVPVYAAIGNHDVLYQGNIPVSLRGLFNSLVEKYFKFMILNDPMGDQSRAVILPGTKPPVPGKLKPGRVVADTRRMGMEGRDLIRSCIQTSRPVSGFPKELAGKEFGHYTAQPKKDLPIKMIVLDSTSRVGTALGLIDYFQFNDFLIPELEKAKKEKQLVLVVSHHPGSSITTLDLAKKNMVSQFGRNNELKKLAGELMANIDSSKKYISRNLFEETLKSYPNVFALVAGHRHSNKITPVGKGLNGYWEIQTCSLIDFPQQARVLEVVYEGNGIGAIQTAIIDHNSKKGGLANYSRELAYGDQNNFKESPLDFKPSPGSKLDRNTILRFEIPADIAKKLES